MATLKEALTLAHQSLMEGSLGQAEDIYRQVLQERPENPAALHWLGVLFYQTGRHAEAEASLRMALAILPDNATCLNNLGLAVEGQQRPEEAAELFRRALALRPDFKDPLLNLGNLRHAQARLAEAEKLYRDLLALHPEFGAAYCCLGATLKEQGRVEEALEAFRRAIALDPSLAPAHYNLAGVLEARGDVENAKAHYQEALRLNPDWEDAIAGQASLLERLGRYDEALAILDPRVKAGKSSTTLSLNYATVCRRLGRSAEAAEHLETLIDSTRYPSRRRALLFELGNLHDQLGSFDKAFAFFQEANALRQRPFDMEQRHREFERIREVFSPEFMRGAPRATVSSQLPVFIVGMPRSGTTLVEQILASHPAVLGAGELDHIPELVASLGGSGADYAHLAPKLTQENIDALSARQLRRLQALDPFALRITDKMPGNFLRLGLLEMLFPQARIIHCRRDPLDTCLSCYFTDFLTGHAYSYDLENLGRFYRDYVRLMEHWRSVLAIPILDVQYEDLVANQEAASRRLVEFCGLDWNDRCLKFFENKRHISTASYSQVRRPIYQSSLGRSRHYLAHLEPLRKALATDS